jgi:beta-xylosidase
MPDGTKAGFGTVRQKTGKTLTSAKVLFAPPYSAIDGTLLEPNGIYYLFHKKEEFGAKTGERRAIRVATSNSPEGPYKTIEGQ